MLTKFLNWLSVQLYYAEGGAIIPTITVFIFDALYYVALFTLILCISAWVTYPLSCMVARKKQRQHNAVMEVLALDTLATNRRIASALERMDIRLKGEFKNHELK